MDTLLKKAKAYKTKKQRVPHKYGYGVRHIQAAIFFLCLTNTYIAKGHMGVTIVAMTSNNKVITLNYNKSIDYIYTTNGSNTSEFINASNTDNYLNSNESDSKFNQNLLEHSTIENTGNYFNWTKSTQEMVLGSFYLGNCIMMFPSGMICQRWGGKIVLQVALFINGIVSIIIPWLTVWGGWRAICFCRILQGFTQAGTYPSLHTLLAKWVPISERAKITSFVYTGIPIGNGLAFQLGGILGDSQWSWPATFWAVGTINLIMFSLLTIFGYATPMEHSKITREEKEYILGTIDTDNIMKPHVPWKEIATSKPMWGTMAAHIGNGLSFVFIFTQVPSYLHYILGITVKNSGLLTSLQYASAIVFSISVGWLSDWVTNKKIVSIRNARRISNSLSLCGVALGLICVSFTKNMSFAVICFMIATSSDAFANAGYMVNYIDLAPNFSGLLMAIGSTLMNLFVVSLPIVVSLIVIDVTNLIQWRIMFFIVAGVTLGSNFIFVLLMSSETQPWNNINKNKELRSNKKCSETQKIEVNKEKRPDSYESEDSSI